MGRAKIISVINWKGGVGKTTLTHHLGTGFAHLTDVSVKNFTRVPTKKYMR